MEAVPAATGVTTPEEFTVATAEFELDHVPPVAVVVYVEVPPPAQSVVAPET